MINQIKLAWKLLTLEFNTLNSVWKLVCTAVGYISSFFSLAVLLKDLVGWNKLEMWTKAHWLIVVLIGIFASCIHNRSKLNCCKIVSNRDTEIAIIVKDIFSNKSANSFIIPTNSFFRTKMDNEYISHLSVQGSFQLKYFRKNIDDLNEKINNSLRIQNIDGEDAIDCFGPTKKYPIGTVAKVDHKGKHFFFVAVNDVNMYGKPEGQTIENVTTALTCVIEAIRRMGHCDTLCVPLIGSGRAAIAEATKEFVSKITIDYFVQSEAKIANKVIIAIHPEDYLSGKIDLDKIKKYLDYRCEFYEKLTHNCVQ